ncbi:hypothetical protein ACQ4M4_09255 [Leptolyngbya sp. AN02str]|uniref:hypothetical protein n=1 Tax=Leptolyngbya sp. AN02str TaxID=3423363 RepID=UPI003D319E85
MDLDQQIQELIEQAPQDGVTPDAVRAIAPVLKLIAGQLKHPQYFVLQTLDGRWIMTTLSHRTQPNTQKNMFYAYADLKDATASPYAKDPQVVALPVAATHILFQMVAMTTVDSAIFFETSGNVNSGTEVLRSDVQNLIQAHLQQFKQGSRPPTDIA